jgi:hypothetical protein
MGLTTRNKKNEEGKDRSAQAYQGAPLCFSLIISQVADIVVQKKSDILWRPASASIYKTPLAGKQCCKSPPRISSSNRVLFGFFKKDTLRELNIFALMQAEI